MSSRQPVQNALIGEVYPDNDGLGPDRLGNLARQAAESHTVSRLPPRRPSLLEYLEKQESVLRDAYRHFAGASEVQLARSYVAEWLLDNFYVVEQALRQIREDMPVGYYRQLPQLDASSLMGYPRIYGVAREVTKYSQSHLDLDEVTRFVQAYQVITPLTIGELWALPTMLRLAVLENLTQAVARAAELPAGESGAPADVAATPSPEDREEDVVVANCILSLLTLTAQDWKVFFESVSRVEQVLRRDPADIYARMDFDTRNRYRAIIEELALATGRDEEAVAWEALGLAQAERDQTEEGKDIAWNVRAHVGFYLLDVGRAQLEERVGYRPRWHRRPSRWLLRHPALAYLGGIGLLTLLTWLSLLCYAVVAGGRVSQWIGAGVLSVLPATAVAIGLVNWLVSHRVPPRLLARLDFDRGVPAGCRTMVVVPALLTNADEAQSLLQQLELHYLGNADPHVHFALLTDFSDAPQEHLPGDDALLERVKAGVQALNRKYGQGAVGPFYLFHRARVYNPAEECWMGWERKRGKLVEFNRLLGGKETSYHVQIGDLTILPEIKYVITLDADTLLPRESARRLIATLAHPLNRARFDPESDAVVAGYTVLQPRVAIKPTAVGKSLFAQVFSGDTGVDLYTRAVSEVYQDLFGAGIYAGKGIYDIAAFERSLVGRVPDNALLSHDLFEGVYGRVGLVTDVVVYEDYPSHYLAYVRRMHRWVRGDWQLLPWLWPRVPRAEGVRMPNELSLIDRWKILDNLRRSLLAPALLALLVAGWLWLPGSPLVWTLAALLALAVPVYTSALTALVQEMGRASLGGAWQPVRVAALRWLLEFILLPYETLIITEGIAATLIRLTITRKRLLRWTTAAHTIRLFGAEIGLGLFWKKMGSAVILSSGLALLIVLLNAGALPVAMPLLLAWMASPFVAHRVSRPLIPKQTTLLADQRQQLRRLARRTWLYFEHFVGPDAHWLPPDHFQEEPLGLPAHRTSPTNLGLLLLSTLAAYDLGYINPLELVLRLRSAFEGMDKLERYRGHFLNWYETRNLKFLPPRYVSTVDSGNLAGCLLALQQGLRALPSRPALRWQCWQGFLDALEVLTEVVEGLGEGDDAAFKTSVRTLRDCLANLHQQVLAVRDRPGDWPALLDRLCDDAWPELEQRLVLLVESGLRSMKAATLLHDLRLWRERVHHHLSSMRRERDMFLPWLLPLSQPPMLFTQTETDSIIAEAWQALVETLPTRPPAFEQTVEVCRAGQARVGLLQAVLTNRAGLVDRDRIQEARDWCMRLAERLTDAQRAVDDLLSGLKDLGAQAEACFQGMDFGFLFDPQRQVFHIGYDVEAERPDHNYYDLLASEARIASLLAIAKGDVPQSHWLHLSRPMTQVNDARALLSWGGTMFEYLMPCLLMRSYEGTLLNQSCRAAVSRQMAYARQRGVPWGISESGYYQFDAARHYQYRGFGVPGLGLKRGLDEDVVIAPYASLLALPLEPQAVMQNIQRLNKLGMLGHYGFYEALDYTGSRLPPGQQSAIVRSYMVHHQGMTLLALTNFLQDDVMVRRLHADPRVRSVELLLHEQIPQQAPTETPHPEEVRVIRPAEVPVALVPWDVPIEAPMPQVHLLSNGRYSVLVTSAGSGYSSWRGVDLTRWRADTTLDDWGTWIYVQDRDSGALWSAGYQPTRTPPTDQTVRFHPHMAEFWREDRDICVRTEITVPPDDDVEIRQITLTNHSDHPRRLTLTSYGEVVLVAQEADRRHPAFNGLFVESDYLPELNALLFRRRPRSAEEEPIYLAHLLVAEKRREITGAHESDRARFLGRGGAPRSPAALRGGSPGLSGAAGATLDPIMALGQEVELEPHATEQIAYVTLAAGSRQEALALARRYQTWPDIRRAFDRARSSAELELRGLNLSTPDVARIQQLLSVLIYPHAALRASPATLAANSKGQPGLWPYAISGDYPIILAHISSEGGMDLVREALQAHAYWRRRQAKIDLVILNEHGVGYEQKLHTQLYRLIDHLDATAWLNRRGGIFLLRADQVSEADRMLLEAAARASLDEKKGRLGEHLGHLLEQPVRLPHLVPTLPGAGGMEPTPPLARPTDLLFDNGLGGFSADGREYVVYLEPGEWTPAPWTNVIAYPNFGFLVSEAGAGYTWAENSGENRLTPWRNDPVTDMPGEALYLRDEETAHVWSPTPLPARAPAPYLIRHGAGYSVFQHHSHGLKQRLRLFAVPNAPVKVVQLRLENTWNQVRRITATYYAEWVLGTTRDTTQQYILPEVDAGSKALLARNPYNEAFGKRVAFLAASKEPHGMTADRTEFLGRAGNLSHPAALDRIGLASVVEAGLDPCAALQIHLDLAPGETQNVYFLLGQGADRQETLELITRYQDAAQVEAAWEDLAGFWDNLLDAVTVQTPDPAMSLLLNRWLLYQTLSCRMWGRSALYQSSGAFGYRDQLQDAMALVHAAPEITREHILHAARHQFKAGDVLHWWHPLSGGETHLTSSPGVRTRCSDDLLWLPFVTAHYVATTGDESVLVEEIPFLKGAPLEPDEVEHYGNYESTLETYTLYEHCRRALEKGTTAGPHGLPLMGSGDWNDGLNRVGIGGKGESVWLGWFLYAALTRFGSLCERKGDKKQAARYWQRACDLLKVLEANAWDGSWYRRAYFDDGTPLGSIENRECQIDSIAQSWAVLSGAADGLVAGRNAARSEPLMLSPALRGMNSSTKVSAEVAARAAQAMEAVADQLVRRESQLILLLAPPFDRTELDPGYIKGYPPGIRENGGQYTHAALWTVWAFAELGQGDRAEALFRLLNPIYHSNTPEKVMRYRVEPYVVAADVSSVPPHTGRGGWTWYTGSAGWMYRLGLEMILGLRREGRALRIDPCIPKDWSGYELTYRDGKSSYHIRVDNPDGVNRSVKQVTLDDEVLPGEKIPLHGDGRQHRVRVLMG